MCVLVGGGQCGVGDLQVKLRRQLRAKGTSCTVSLAPDLFSKQLKARAAFTVAKKTQRIRERRFTAATTDYKKARLVMQRISFKRYRVRPCILTSSDLSPIPNRNHGTMSLPHKDHKNASILPLACFPLHQPPPKSANSSIIMSLYRRPETLSFSKTSKSFKTPGLRPCDGLQVLSYSRKLQCKVFSGINLNLPRTSHPAAARDISHDKSPLKPQAFASRHTSRRSQTTGSSHAREQDLLQNPRLVRATTPQPARNFKHLNFVENAKMHNRVLQLNPGTMHLTIHLPSG
ncbi:hypothetical protein BST61_g10101 [Cercospora zeina]